MLQGTLEKILIQRVSVLRLQVGGILLSNKFISIVFQLKVPALSLHNDKWKQLLNMKITSAALSENKEKTNLEEKWES